MVDTLIQATRPSHDLTNVDRNRTDLSPKHPTSCDREEGENSCVDSHASRRYSCGSALLFLSHGSSTQQPP